MKFPGNYDEAKMALLDELMKNVISALPKGRTKMEGQILLAASSISKTVLKISDMVEDSSTSDASVSDISDYLTCVDNGLQTFCQQMGISLEV